MEDVLNALNPWWSKEYRPPGIFRETYVRRALEVVAGGRVAILHGLRRVGKTTILKHIVSHLCEEVGRGKVFYASLDHPMLTRVSILELLGAMRRMNRVAGADVHYLLLDEVQRREGFETELKALHDIGDGLRIIASGSSSLVVRHRSGALTGRYSRIPVEPLSFPEYLDFTGAVHDPNEPPIMEALADDHVRNGGMPEYVLEHDPEHLIDVVDDIIFKDISLEYELRDPALLKELFFHLMTRVGRPMSYPRMGRLVGIGPDAARKYVGYFQETFLVGLVERHGTPGERKHSPRKCYCPDNGIRAVIAGEAGVGALAENAVYNLLRPRGDVRYVARDRTEVDFLVGDLLVEVKYKDSLTEDDVEPLRSARVRGVKNKLIVTRGESATFHGVAAVPLWRLLVAGIDGIL